MAKAFGFSPGQQDAWSKQIDRWGVGRRRPTSTDIPEQVVAYANELQTFPRHLGIHSGGMVICDRPVIEVCPVEWARMPGRTVLQWDKDDCAAVGLVKFDLLGLGMLSALHYAVRLRRARPSTWARMTWTTPRSTTCSAGPTRSGCSRWRAGPRWRPCPGCKPARVLRPGGGGGADPARPDPGRLGAPVHPPQATARSRSTSAAPAAARTRWRSTLGVPLFQEQLMQLAIDVAGFDAAGADQLRRAMGAKRSAERMARIARAAVRRHGRSGASPGSWPTTSSASSPRSPTTASRRATR